MQKIEIMVRNGLILNLENNLKSATLLLTVIELLKFQMNRIKKNKYIPAEILDVTKKMKKGKNLK